jgi:hypothetical protein
MACVTDDLFGLLARCPPEKESEAAASSSSSQQQPDATQGGSRQPTAAQSARHAARPKAERPACRRSKLGLARRREKIAPVPPRAHPALRSGVDQVALCSLGHLPLWRPTMCALAAESPASTAFRVAVAAASARAARSSPLAPIDGYAALAASRQALGASVATSVPPQAGPPGTRPGSSVGRYLTHYPGNAALTRPLAALGIRPTIVLSPAALHHGVRSLWSGM